MAEPIKLTTEGTLLNWLKDVGDKVSAGEIVAEVEADKATVEIEAPADGVIVEIRAQVGDDLAEGDVIAMLGVGDEAPESVAQNGKQEKSEAKDEEPAEEADNEEEKATEASSDGRAAASNGTQQASTTPEGRVKASPVARKMAEDRGIDLNQVKGSGPEGRVVKADVENFEPSKAADKEKAAPAPAARATYGELPEEDVEVIEIKRMRRLIADSTILSKQQIPHFYVTVEIDVGPLLALRKELNDNLSSDGVKISVNDMMIKAAALALRKFPNLNTHYYGDKLVRHKRINIGVSVALPNNGLANVVCKDADKTALSVMAEENKAMYDRAREGKIKPDDLKGATFTISNLGPYNVEEFSAIIAPPEAAILAVSSARKVPIVKEDGSLGVSTRMKVTISVDHRVSDGAEGAEYLNELRALIENPMRLVV
jgi:pyruvate dehydrogenase E2 component (dihydrolipoamide acetyltransferase)